MISTLEVATYDNGDPQAKKFALFLPGLLDTKDYAHMRSHVDYFAELGYYAVSIDMPGTWESGNDIADFTTTNCLAAIKKVIATANRPTFLFGHSNGGRLAALASAQNSQVEAVAIAMSATTTYGAEQAEKWHEDGVKVSLRDLPDNAEKTREFRLPYAFYEDAIKYDGREALRALTIPKIFIFSGDDALVNPAEVQQTFKVAAYPKQLVSFHVPHDYRRDSRFIDRMNDIVSQFLLSRGLLPQ